jgi:hypothetical protein
MFRLSYFLVGALLVAQGCAVTKQLVPVGGSRADGTVKMAYSYTGLESPQVDRQQAIDSATARCAAWGYKGAEPFGGSMKQCTRLTRMGCGQMTVTVEFQCTGSTAPPAN